jgi:hypothetical protein
MSNKCHKIKMVVFDLDETLGYFSEFGMIWDAITKNAPNQNITQTLFDEILDLFPEFLRPNILHILIYLKQQKIKTKCNKLILYTNNQGPSKWARYIIKYFENKVNYKLFDQIISAYKINGRQVEMCRTTSSKTHDDLLKCTKLSQNVEICFLDDLYHPGMDNDNVYYINLKPYKYDLSFTEILNRVVNHLKKPNSNTYSTISGTNENINEFKENEFKEEFIKYLNRYHYSPKYKSVKEQHVDKIISKRILYHLKDFFNDTKHKINRKTQKYKKHIVKKNKSLKK